VEAIKMKGIFKEKWEGYREELTTIHGILSFFILNLFEGFIIVTYTDEIFGFILSKMPFTGFFQTYLAYISFSLTTTGIYLILLIILTGLLREIGFKDRRIFR